MNRASHQTQPRSLGDLSPLVSNLLAIPVVSGGITLPTQINATLPKCSNEKCSFQSATVSCATIPPVPNSCSNRYSAYLEDKRITVADSKAVQEPQIEFTDLEAEQEEFQPLSKDSELTEKSQPSQLLSGIAKTYSKWRASVKGKRKFNFEKYITYLDNTLPTIGFSIGGVVITWDAVLSLCFLLFTLVGIFAQEALFGR